MIENFSKEELNNEQWRDIDGYEGMYQVSDLGRVRSKHSGEWKVLKPNKTKNGYLTVVLHNDKKQKKFYVHRLVADAFIPNSDETKTIINHKNECKDFNNVDNLEWCDRQYNNTYNDIDHRRKKRCCPVQEKIKDLYDPTLTWYENIELFKANGIECSKRTVVKLRKNLGITRKCTKKVKIAKLYNPDLTISDNLEIFKANGFECCEKTVRDLRKDLGLARHCKPRKKTN